MTQPEANIRLKSLRENNNLTQEQLAKYLNVDQSVIIKLEHGIGVFSVTIIDKICSLFGCSEEYLLGKSSNYMPLSFGFGTNSIQTEDFQSVAAVNRIAMNIRYMNEMIREMNNRRSA